MNSSYEKRRTAILGKVVVFWKVSRMQMIYAAEIWKDLLDTCLVEADLDISLPHRLKPPLTVA